MSDKINNLTPIMADTQRKEPTKEKRVYIRVTDKKYRQLASEAGNVGLGIGPYLRQLVETHPLRQSKK